MRTTKEIREDFDKFNHLGSIQAIEDFFISVIEADRRELREAVESLWPEPVDEDFNDGGDDEYRSRRIAVDNARYMGRKTAIDSVLRLLDGSYKPNTP